MANTNNTKGYIFSYHNLLENTDGMQVSDFYKDKQLDYIKDPEGGNTKKIPTSIPSPFATIDLTASAFSVLSRLKGLKGNEINEKIVSQCWDIGMLFFNKLSLGERLEIIAWNREEEINKMLASDSFGHKLLGSTLQMFLEDDSRAYNFDQYQSIYLLKYNHNYFGGTSPKTLFFSTLNPLEDDTDNHINLGGDDILFDKEYAQLYERPADFQLFIYRLTKNIANFSTRCVELSKYLVASKEILKTKNKALYDEIDKIQQKDYNEKYTLTAVGGAGSYVNVLGVTIRSKKPKEDGKSDFKLLSEKYTGKEPMLLFPGFGGQNLFGNKMTYFDCEYSKDIDKAVPYYSNEKDINNRILPGLTAIKYPYLLVDDLLEDTLFKVPFSIDENFFFNGNFNGEDIGYLLPLRKEFFKYFDAEELYNKTMEDGKPLFEFMEQANNSIKAILRLPIKGGGYITFEKNYLESSRIDTAKNIGAIATISLDINIFPFIKNNTELKIEYRTHFILNSFAKTPNFEFNKNDGSTISGDNLKKATDKGSKVEAFQVYITPEHYDYISITSQNKSALFIPKWEETKPSSDEFHFAIDFGTTNTYIEYAINGKDSGVFEMGNYLGRFSLGNEDYVDVSNQEFIPARIKRGTHYKFSQRTAIAVTKTVNYQKPVYSLADFRIPFYYESDDHPTTSNYFTNLKWSNYANEGKVDNSEKHVTGFIEQLVLMMKTKVLVEGGDLALTKFTWFFPSSMARGRQNKLEKLWLELLSKHFGIRTSNIKKVPESIAPFAFYKAKQNIDATVHPAVSIDIGGGTSDMVVFDNDMPLYMSSFRYAGNSIFGDGYTSNANKNGYILRYKNKLKEALVANSLTNLLGAFKGVEKQDSSDIIAFFMSLKDNVDIKDKFDISFQKLLANDPDLKATLLLFYHGLIYHIANYIKNVALEMPENLIFSGKGGNVLKLLDDSLDFDILAEYTKLIFTKVLGEECEHNINLVLSENPKAVTCKGGLLIDEEMIEKSKKISKVIVGAVEEPTSLPKYPEIAKGSDILNSVKLEVRNAIDQFYLLNDDFNYLDNFEINAGALQLMNEKISDDAILKGLLKGLDQKKRELATNDNKAIEEPLFFYAYNYLLNDLAYHIVKGK